MVTLINPPSKLHYLRMLRSPALLGCDCKYQLRGHGALRGLGFLHAIGDATGAGVAAGTVLAYSASWSDSIAQLKNPDAVQVSIQGKLANQWGIVIDSQWHSQSDYFNFSGKQSMTLQVHTVSDYGAADDIRSIIDNAIYTTTQSMPVSAIRVVRSVSPEQVSPTTQFPADTGAAIAAAQAGYADAVARGDQTSAAQFAAQLQKLQNPSSPVTWLSNNWPWLALGVGGAIVLKEVL